MEPAEPVTPDDLRACRTVLEAIIRDRGLLAGLSLEERTALLHAAGRVSHPNKHEHRKEAKSVRKAKRAERQERDREAVAATAIREAREAPVFVAPPLLGDGAAQPERELERPRDCYVCKQAYKRVHFFYDSMCPACAELNYAKRFQTASLDGRVALITGARVKIGYQAALKLLRAGAHVLVSTRFPHDAARRFAAEADAPEWAGRLDVYGLDLRHAPSVEAFAERVVQGYDRLDFIVNNAAQTVRRPPGFYAPLLAGELVSPADLPPLCRGMVARWHDLRADLRGRARDDHALVLPAAGDALELPADTPRRALGLVEPARLAQLRTATDGEDGFHVFPVGQVDADGQQVDLRAHNSWRMTLAEVPAWEMLEVQLVNAVAPFILAARLKPLMLRERTFDKHVVNVSAMEGSFSRGTKTDKHPHTNMAKAALNMMTLTSAPDYARDGIYMNAVDTGWVTDEDPALHATRKKTELDFQPPLDVVDGAARVLDPIFAGLLSGAHAWGKFFKDYAPTTW